MRILFGLCLLILFSACPQFSLAGEPQQGDLNLQLSGIDPQAGGTLRVALFRGEAGWPKFARALQRKALPADSSDVALSFVALPYADDYAVEIHHDANGNDKFDMRWLPYPRPKEGYGVSNNIIGFGTPDFADARFSIEQPQTTLQIRMHY